MMKARIVMISVLMLGILPHASADVYVKVDANGNTVGEAIVCDAATCGQGSDYSKLTLAPGEQYVLQNRGQAGIANNTPGVQVKVDLATNEWSATSSTVTNIQPVQVTPEVKLTKVEIITETTWNPITVSVPVSSQPETSTVTSMISPRVESTTKTTQVVKPWFELLEEFDWDVFWQEFSVWLEAWDWSWND